MTKARARSSAARRIRRALGEQRGRWQGHAPDVLLAMQDNVAPARQLGIEAIDD